MSEKLEEQWTDEKIIDAALVSVIEDRAILDVGANLSQEQFMSLKALWLLGETKRAYLREQGLLDFIPQGVFDNKDWPSMAKGLKSQDDVFLRKWRQDSLVAIKKLRFETISELKEKGILLVDEEKIREVFSMASKANLIYVDSETSGLNYREPIAIGISMKVNDRSCYIPWGHQDYVYPDEMILGSGLSVEELKLTNIGEEPKQQADADLIKELWPDLVAKVGAEKWRFFNKPFDRSVLGATLGGTIDWNDDSYDVHHLAALFVERESRKLKDLGEKYIENDAKDEQSALKAYSYDIANSGHLKVPPYIEAPYAAKDCELTEAVDKVFYALAQTEQQLEPLKIETRLMELLWKIETRGLLIDVEYVKEQIAKSEKVVSQLEKEFVISSEQSVDIFSEESLKKLLYETWKLPVGRKTDKGEPAVDTWALERLRYDNPEWAPELKNLEEISSLNTMTRKFYAPLLENVKEDNYIFTRYNQMPKSGNISNMQTNIFQVSEEHAKEALRAFVVPEKKAWLIFDYSQIEMRILASYSRDERMVDVFARGGDLHQQTADLMKIDREVAKNLNYAMAYGWGLPQLARTAGITEEDARELKSFHRDAYPKAREFFKTAENKSAARGWVHTLSGKRRRFNDKFHKAAGLLVQGSSSDIFRKSLLEVDACLTKEFARDAELIAFSDGELIVEVEKGLEKRVAVAVAQTMKTIYSPPLVVPLGVDISLCRKNWVEREPFHREVLVAKPEPQEVEINEDSVELV